MAEITGDFELVQITEYRLSIEYKGFRGVNLNTEKIDYMYWERVIGMKGGSFA